jgi:hypothetical protein
MGFDLKGYFQRRDRGGWKDIEEFRISRNYTLYGWMGLGVGAAGRDGAPSLPALRGLPPDFEMLDRFDGEFGANWLLSEEVLNAPRPHWPRRLFVPRSTFEHWEGPNQPDAYEDFDEEDMLRRGAIAAFPADLTAETLWVLVDVDFDLSLDEEFIQMVKKFRDMHQQYGQVRFVFGLF